MLHSLLPRLYLTAGHPSFELHRWPATDNRFAHLGDLSRHHLGQPDRWPPCPQPLYHCQQPVPLSCWPMLPRQMLIVNTLERQTRDIATRAALALTIWIMGAPPSMVQEQRPSSETRMTANRCLRCNSQQHCWDVDQQLLWSRQRAYSPL